MKPNILFINLPSIPFDSLIESFMNRSEIVQPLSMPMGILYMSSYLKKHNEVGRIAILDYVLPVSEIAKYKDLDDYVREVARKEIDFVPDILAFSLIFSTTHRLFNIAVTNLKSLWGGATTIVGGTHATNCTSKILENKNVDFVARGEGELALSTFVSQYANSETIDVRGIYSKEKMMTLKAPLELCTFPEDLDSLPFPDWDLIDMQQYINAKGRKRSIGSSEDKNTATIITTRGCAFSCTFCSSHTVHGRKMRFRSAENVVEEVRQLYDRYGITLFIPEDDLFTVNRNRIVKLLNSIKELQIPDMEMQYPSALSINTLDERVMDALIVAGMKVGTLAIESGSPYVQKNIIKKNCNLNKAKDVVKYLKNKGLIVRCYYVMGFPLETKEHLIETIEYARNLGADWSVFNIAAPLIGSEMYYQFVEMGYIKDDIEMWSKAFFQERQFDTKEISAVELKDLAYRANLDVNFINNINLINCNFERARDIFKDIVMTYPFHIVGWYCLMKSYKGLGDVDQMQLIVKKIRDLIASDERAQEMYHKYRELMPDFIWQ